MTKNIFIFLLGMTLTYLHPALAQQTKFRKSLKNENTKKVSEIQTPGDSYYQFGPRFLLWQESIPATRPGEKETLDSQFQGVSLATIYRKPTSSIRWVQAHALDLSFGTLVAKSIGSSITDQLRNQMWYALTFSPGFGYRTTSVSEIGLSLPISYRIIQWETNDPTLKLDRESSFSYGISGVYINQLSKQSALQISLTNQIEWKTFAWSLGWNYRFL